MVREVTLASRLRASGVSEVERAEKWLASDGLAPLVEREDFWHDLAACAQPDQVLLCLMNLFEAVDSAKSLLGDNPQQLSLIIALCGLSRYCADYLIAHPILPLGTQR